MPEDQEESRPTGRLSSLKGTKLGGPTISHASHREERKFVPKVNPILRGPSIAPQQEIVETVEKVKVDKPEKKREKPRESRATGPFAQGPALAPVKKTIREESSSRGSKKLVERPKTGRRRGKGSSPKPEFHDYKSESEEDEDTEGHFWDPEPLCLQNLEIQEKQELDYGVDDVEDLSFPANQLLNPNLPQRGRMFLFQLPPNLPRVQNPLYNEEDESETLPTIPITEAEGMIGELLVYKSGKMTMRVGAVEWQVKPGSNPNFLSKFVAVTTPNVSEEAMEVEGETAMIHELGNVGKRFICVPNPDSLLDL